MRRVVSMLVVIAALGAGCSSEPDCFEFCSNARVRGVLHVGDKELTDFKWIEMIQLSGPPGERCGPGACGMAYAALRGGIDWTPGKWRVIPPRVRGWIAPHAIVVVIRQDHLTTFEASYRRA